MHLGIISDIHSNVAALNAVLSFFDKRRVDAVICAGDLVGYNCEPKSVIDVCRLRGIASVKGNHDALIESPEAYAELAAIKREPLAYAASALTQDDLDYLRTLPVSRRMDSGACGIAVFHGSPRDPLNEYIYPDRVATLDPVDVDVLILGHTHIPYVGWSGNTLVLNPGGCGVCRDGDPRAGCIILNTVKREAEVCRVPYDPWPVIEANKRSLTQQTTSEYLLLGRKAQSPLDWTGDHRDLWRSIELFPIFMNPCAAAFEQSGTNELVLISAHSQGPKFRVRCRKHAEAVAASPRELRTVLDTFLECQQTA